MTDATSRPVRRPERLRRPKFLASCAADMAICLALIATCIWPPGAIIYGNMSPSLPTGLYLKSANSEIGRGHLVAAYVPKDWSGLVKSRGYLAQNSPLLKRVRAKDGDKVCALGPSILINNIWAASRLERDRFNRSLPWWSGCYILQEGEFFLMGEGKYSFDGRYFGVTQQSDIIAKVTYLGG